MLSAITPTFDGHPITQHKGIVLGDVFPGVDLDDEALGANASMIMLTASRTVAVVE
ncbi:hypothetical protein ACTOVL_01420 [Arcanobacterium canis]